MRALTLLLVLAAAITVLIATAASAESLDSEQYGIEEYDDDVEDTSKWTSRSLLDDRSLPPRSSPPPPRPSPPPPPRKSPPPPPTPSPPPPPRKSPPPPPRPSPPPPPRKSPPPPPYSYRSPPPPPRSSTCRTNRTLCLQPGSAGPDCCNGICTNVLTDERNCAFCNIPCLFGRTCCGRSGCVDTMINNRHCGMCNNLCPPVRGTRVPGRCRGGLCEYSG